MYSLVLVRLAMSRAASHRAVAWFLETALLVPSLDFVTGLCRGDFWATQGLRQRRLFSQV